MSKSYTIGNYNIHANIYYDNVNKCYHIGYQFGKEYVIIDKKFETEIIAYNYLRDKFIY